MDYLKIWDIMLRRRKVIIYVFLAFFVPVVIGTFVMKKIYSAEARVLVKQSDNLNSVLKSLGILSSTTSSSASTAAYDTEVTLTTSIPLLKKLIKQLDLKDSDGESMKPADMITGRLKKYVMPAPYVEAEQDDDADIVLITAKGTTAQQAADIATATGLLLIEESKNRTSLEYTAARKAIEAQIDEIENSYSIALENMQNDMVKNQYIDLTMETQSQIDAIQKLKSSLLDAERDIVAAQKKDKEIRQQLATTKKFRTEYEEFKENKQLSDLKTKLNDRLVNIAGKAVEKRPDHPDYKLLESESEAAKKIIKQEADLLLDAKKLSIDPVYASLELSLSQNAIDLITAIAKKKEYTDFIASYNKELLTIPVKKTGFSKFDLELSLKKTLLSDLKTTLSKVYVAEKLSLSNIRMVEPAEPPEKQTFPNKAVNLVCGFVFGLLFGILAAFFLESVDKTINDPKDFTRLAHLNYLGTILKSRDLVEKRIISNLPPLSPVVEAFRTIRNGINNASADSPVKTVTVTGPIGEEGVTSVAANLAISYSMDGRRVMLVEMNTREPMLAEYFGVSVQKGVAGVLTGTTELQQAILHSGVTGVDLLICDSAVPNQGKLPISQRFKDMLRSLEQNYDLVILDVPPTIPVNDSVEIGRNTDGTILVTEASKTTFSMLEQSLEKFEKSGVRLLGAVINKKQHCGSRYYSYFSSKKDKYTA